jgi:hypothetical protein
MKSIYQFWKSLAFSVFEKIFQIFSQQKLTHGFRVQFQDNLTTGNVIKLFYETVGGALSRTGGGVTEYLFFDTAT